MTEHVDELQKEEEEDEEEVEQEEDEDDDDEILTSTSPEMAPHDELAVRRSCANNTSDAY